MSLSAGKNSALRLAPLFSDHMVLQRGLPVPVWGWSKPGEKVTIRFGAQKVSSTADAKGRWKARLNRLEAGGPFEIMIDALATGERLTIRDVLVGEVYLCSGQSNMN